MADQEFADYVSFEEFRDGMPVGRFHVIVEPKKARRYVSQRLMLLVLLMPMVGIGLALALTGRVWAGAALVALGVVLSRVVRAQSGKILLHLASRNRAVYEQVTQHGIMEVRRV